MKKPLKIIVPLVIIILIILFAYIFTSAKKRSELGANNNLENLAADTAKAQSYVAPKAPSLKNDDKILGSKDAATKIFVYEDYSSIYSAKYADILDKLSADNSGKLAIIVRPFVTKNTGLAEDAAIAVDCAGDQNKWLEMRALLFAQAKNESLNSADFSKYASQIGLDTNAFAVCLTNQTKSVKIEGLSQEAESYNANGAPTTFVGDEMIIGARPYEDFTDSNGDNIEGLKTMIAKRIK
jgi:protein-disulfide isomerase